MSRDAFLTRVRQAAEVGRAYRVHLDELPESVGYVGTQEVELCQAMAAEVNEVGGMAQIAQGHEAAREQVLDLLDAYRANSVLMWRHDVLERLQLREVLDDADIEVLDHQRMQALGKTEARRAFLAADVGITSCDIAIAETGSLIVCSQPGQERIASLVTPVHIAVVERDQIVPDLFDAFEKLGELGFDAIPSNISIITGPSKTGDIELTLTTGVHGPGKWHVVIVT
jgi:L-lactate utilization protein LutC